MGYTDIGQLLRAAVGLADSLQRELRDAHETIAELDAKIAELVSKLPADDE